MLEKLLWFLLTHTLHHFEIWRTYVNTLLSYLVLTCESAKIKVTFPAFLWIFSDRIIVPAPNIPHFKGLGMIDLQYEIRMYQKINNKSHNENINVKLLWFLLTHTLPYIFKVVLHNSWLLCNDIKLSRFGILSLSWSWHWRVWIRGLGFTKLELLASLGGAPAD